MLAIPAVLEVYTMPESYFPHSLPMRAAKALVNAQARLSHRCSTMRHIVVIIILIPFNMHIDIVSI